MRPFSFLVLAQLVALLAMPACEAAAARLFTINLGDLQLYEIDPRTAAATVVGPVLARSWEDLAARPGETNAIYAVAPDTTPAGPLRESFVSRVDVETGAVVDLFSFTAADLGFQNTVFLEFSGIAIDPATPDRATIGGVHVSFTGITSFVFDLDLDTGDVFDVDEVTVPSLTISDLAYAPDGGLLSLSGVPAEISLVDRAAGVAGTVGECGCRVLDFGPDGAFYTIDDGGDLVLRSRDTGEVLETIGATGLAGAGAGGVPHGLAFVVPEPGTGALLAMGLAGLAGSRRRRV